MSKEIDLNIKVTPLVEDCFYLLLAINDEISEEQGAKVYDRIKGAWTKREYEEAFLTAQRMIENLKKYGVACAEWA